MPLPPPPVFASAVSPADPPALPLLTAAPHTAPVERLNSPAAPSSPSHSAPPSPRLLAPPAPKDVLPPSAPKDVLAPPAPKDVLPPPAPKELPPPISTAQAAPKDTTPPPISTAAPAPFAQTEPKSPRLQYAAAFVIVPQPPPAAATPAPPPTPEVCPMPSKHMPIAPTAAAPLPAADLSHFATSPSSVITSPSPTSSASNTPSGPKSTRDEKRELEQLKSALLTEIRARKALEERVGTLEKQMADLIKLLRANPAAAAAVASFPTASHSNSNSNALKSSAPDVNNL